MFYSQMSRLQVFKKLKVFWILKLRIRQYGLVLLCVREKHLLCFLTLPRFSQSTHLATDSRLRGRVTSLRRITRHTQVISALFLLLSTSLTIERMSSLLLLYVINQTHTGHFYVERLILVHLCQCLKYRASPWGKEI